MTHPVFGCHWVFSMTNNLYENKKIHLTGPQVQKGTQEILLVLKLHEVLLQLHNGMQGCNQWYAGL